jgi:hypothetical protein
VMEKWFYSHQDILQNVKSELLVNFDESMISPSKRRVTVVVPSDTKKAIHQVITNNEHVTMCSFIWANGDHSTPNIILPLKNLPSLPTDIISEFTWSGSSEGWITDVIFENILLNCFIPEVQTRRTKFGLSDDDVCVLVIDGHGSRANLTVIEKLKCHKIVMLTIPQHSSHIIQPLDNGIFAMLKKELALLKKRIVGKDQATRRVNLLWILSLAIVGAFRKDRVISSFQKTGIRPWNPNAILRHPSLTDIPTRELIKDDRPRLSISGIVLTNDTFIAKMREYEEKKEEKRKEKEEKEKERKKKREEREKKKKEKEKEKKRKDQTKRKRNEKFNMDDDDDVDSIDIEDDIDSVDVEDDIESERIEDDVESIEVEDDIDSIEVKDDINSVEVEDDIESKKVEDDIDSIEVKDDIDSVEVEDDINSKINNDKKKYKRNVSSEKFEENVRNKNLKRLRKSSIWLKDYLEFEEVSDNN